MSYYAGDGAQCRCQSGAAVTRLWRPWFMTIVRLANCARCAQFLAMLQHIRLRTLWIVAVLALALSACESPHRNHQPGAPAPPASSVPLQPPLLSVPAQSLQWDKPGVSDSQRQADVESCYAYARATIEHDNRIDSDRTAGLLDNDKGQGDIELRQRMRHFSQGNQRVRLMNSCMESKGYQAGS